MTINKKKCFTNFHRISEMDLKKEIESLVKLKMSLDEEKQPLVGLEYLISISDSPSSNSHVCM